MADPKDLNNPTKVVVDLTDGGEAVIRTNVNKGAVVIEQKITTTGKATEGTTGAAAPAPSATEAPKPAVAAPPPPQDPPKKEDKKEVDPLEALRAEHAHTERLNEQRLSHEAGEADRARAHMTAMINADREHTQGVARSWFRSGWFLALCAVILGVAIALFCYWRFVCVGCMLGNMAPVETAPTEETFQLPNEEEAEEPAYEEEVADDFEEEEDETATVSPASGDEFLKALTAIRKDYHLYRFLGDSMDGEHKGLALAAIVATDVPEGPSKQQMLAMANEVMRVTGQRFMLNTDDYAARAFNYSLYAKYATQIKSPHSLDWWINANTSALPSQNETPYSKAVKETLKNGKKAMREGGINVGQLFDDEGVLAVNYKTPRGKAPPRRTRTRRHTAPALIATTANYRSLGYTNPIPSGYKKGDGIGASRNGGRRRHAGQDLIAPQGSAVVSCSPGKGKVIFVGWKSGYGMCVKVRTKDAHIIYAHLSKAHVKKGQVISQGHRVGSVGSTGHSTGPHLHLEFHRRGNAKFTTPKFV